MAREINILRRLDHPNIIKLDGIITSKLSSSIYLVFEYMEHDVAGLLSCTDVKFNEPQIKCYMKQLLSGVEHCHSRGVMHRDIKGANLLVNNDGILKVADFGLANFWNFGQRHPLTSRVVTLWYRPPELLLGSTDYGASVDLWSVGCVFAELLIGKPILQGRTEVEQLHKIFKLCGSPPEDYWKKSKLPHATLFKPQHPYACSLWETFKDLPETAVSMIESLLSVEPHMRGTASTALASEYFKTKPYACDPSSLPKYPPSKEIDAKHREEARKKRANGRPRGPETAKRSTRKQNGISKLAPEEKLPMQSHADHKSNGDKLNHREGDTSVGQQPRKSCLHQREESSHSKNASQEDIPFSGPLQVSGSSGFAWAKRRIDDLSVRSRSRSSSRSFIFEPSINPSNIINSSRDENSEVRRNQINSMDQDSCDTIKPTMVKQWNQIGCADSFDASESYHSQELSAAVYQRDYAVKKRSSLQADQDQGDKIEYSGPLLTQSHRIDELLQKHERQIRQAVRRSWFQKEPF
ncbi:hypothetical protein Leryth_001328 [Lithospermum erythrorhizon]|nr:hypothetical protein Leryth_001328 [Lithospermum erythrorhizon]